LDGSLLAAPTIAKGERLDYTAFSLQMVAVQEWFGWLFVNLDGQAPSMEECFGAAYHIPANWAPERMTVAKTSTYDIAANWKLIIENYMECYHCTSIHPALCRVSQVGSEEGWTHDGTWLGGPMDLKPDAETMSLDGKSYGVTIPTLDDKQRRRVIYLAIAPNLLLSLHPDYIMTHRLDPIEPGRTIVECSWLFAPEATELPDFDPSYASDFWEITNGEDLGACASMQLGLASPGYVPGPFADSELEVFLAQRMMGKGYLDGRLTTPKMPREVVATPS
jgi:Rieske 2Fe-2S family protein